jgi:hypothetical protein
MPLDPNIPLQVKTPEAPSPLQTVGGLMQLRASMTENALRQAQMADVQAQAQQRQRDLESTQKAQEVLRDPKAQAAMGGGDYSSLYNAGVSPNVASTIIANHQAMREKALTISGLEAGQAVQKRELLKKGIEGVLDTDDDNLASQRWPGFVDALAKQAPQVASSLPHDIPPNQIRKTLGDISTNNGIATEILNDRINRAKEQQATATSAAQQKSAEATAAKTGAEASELAFGQTASRLAAAPPATATDYEQQLMTLRKTDPATADRLQAAVPVSAFNPATFAGIVRQASMTGEQQTQATQAASTAAETARHNTAEEAQGRQKVAIEAQAQALKEKTFNATLGQGLDANGQPVRDNNGNIVGSPAAQMIANYEMGGPRVQMELMKSPGLMAQVKNLNPSYDARNYDAASQIRVQKGGNIQALNTAIIHLDQLGAAATAMANGSFVPGNRIYNWVSQTFGSATPTNFDGLKATVSSEMANALKGQATDPEIATLKATVDRANSPQQLAGIVKTYLSVGAAKLNTYDEQYHQAVDRPGQSEKDKDPWHPLLPTAAKVLQDWGVEQKPQVTGPSGGAEFLRTAVGPGGHTIGQKSDGGWYDTQTGQKVQ